MTDFLVAHKGFIGKIVRENNDSIITHKFQVNDISKKIDKIGFFRWTCKTKLEILTASSVEEILIGSLTPFIIVKSVPEGDKTTKQTLYIVGVDLENEKCTPLRKFVVHSSVLLDNRAIHLLNGPSVAICHKSGLSFYTSFKTTTLVCYKHDFSDRKALPLSVVHNCSFCSKNFKIKKVDILDHAYQQDKCLLFTVLTASVKCENHANMKSFAQILLFAADTPTLVETQNFFPEEYIDCVTSVKFKYLRNINDTLVSELYLGTSEGFIVHVVNGKLMNCINVFEESPVLTMETGRSCSFTADIILVGKIDTYTVLNNKLQIQNIHSGYKFLLTGDFLRNGSEQCLFLEDDHIEQTSWLLSDFQNVSYSSAVDNDTILDTLDVQTGIEATVKALKTKHQLEQISLHEEELRLRQRNDFIVDTLCKQKKLVSCDNTEIPSSRQSNMVPLIYNNTDVPECYRHYGNRESIEINVKDIWQRTYRNRWCIGADVECRTFRSLTMWSDVVLTEDTSNSTSMKSCIEFLQTSKHSDDIELDPSVKGFVKGFSESSALFVGTLSDRNRKSLNDICNKIKNKKPERYIKTFVSVMSLPAFNSSKELTANVILNYKYLDELEELDAKFDNCDNKESDCVEHVDKDKTDTGSNIDNESVGRLCVRSCGTVRLNVSDVLEGKFELNFDINTDSDNIFMENIKELQHDRLAWNHIQCKHHVEVVTTPGTLCRFESLLTNQCKFLYQERFDCFVSQNRCLCSVQIQLDERTRDDRQSMIISTRCDEDLFLVVHHLYGYLPDCAVILPRAVSQNATQATCLTALQKEVDFVHAGLKKLLNDSDSMQAFEDLDDENNIRKVGEKFKRRRHDVIQKHNEIIKSDKVQHFMRTYRRIQNRTDSCMLDMIKPW